MAAPEQTRKLIAENRRAKFDYFLEDSIEAGLILTGTEVKALRLGRANIAESYASAEGREIVLINSYIPEYKNANRFNHEPRRHRKLLLHRKQIDKLIAAVQREGRTIVPTKLYWDEKGRGQAGAVPGQGQEDPRQAPDRGRPGLGARQGPADAGQGVGRRSAHPIEGRSPTAGRSRLTTHSGRWEGVLPGAVFLRSYPPPNRTRSPRVEPPHPGGVGSVWFCILTASA